MPSKKILIKKHPKLDWAIALWGGEAIPTKQDKFKLLEGCTGILNENGLETIFETLYIKKPDKNTIQAFEKSLQEFIKCNLHPDFPYKLGTRVEVILSFDIIPKRFNIVDVDNLSKTILDCMKGLVFEDDSQVVNLLAMKKMYQSNGLTIAVNNIDDLQKSWFDRIKLFYIDENENP